MNNEPLSMTVTQFMQLPHAEQADFLQLLSQALSDQANTALNQQDTQQGGYLKAASRYIERASHELQRASTEAEEPLQDDSMSSQRHQLAQWAADTLRILEQGHYTNPQGHVVSVKESLRRCRDNTRLFKPGGYKQMRLPSVHHDTTIQVKAETTLAAAKQLADSGQFERIAVLNFASAKNPGGGFLSGSQAQEESLARSSALYTSLQRCPDFYEYHRSKSKTLLYSNHIVYSPHCPVFRDDAGTLLEAPYKVDIITSPAPNRGAIARNEARHLAEVSSTLIERSERVLKVAAAHSCDAIVLGAWGCGVFGNDAEEVAAAFARHLQGEGAYRHTFKQVLFAVPDNPKLPRNLQAFERYFGANPVCEH